MKQSLLWNDGHRCRAIFWALLAGAVMLQARAQAQVSVSLAGLTHVSCHAGNDGAIDADVSGGMPPYSFAWSHGDSTEDVTGLTAGNYKLVVTDALLQSDSISVSVNQPAQLSASTTTQNASCNAVADGVIDLSVSGGTPPYAYLWNTGDTTQDLNGYPSGSYTVDITDNNGCSLQVSDVIGEPSAVWIVSSMATDVTCRGDSDGTASMIVVGGIMPYSFSWTNGATTQNLTGLPPGSYTLTATDKNGCQDTATVVINEPAQDLTASLGVTATSCFASSDGAINVNVSGGVAPYSYSWNTGASTRDLTGIPVGSYSLSITDANGCVLVKDTVVESSDSIPPMAQCQNLDAYLDASGNAVITAGQMDSGSTDNCAIDTIILDRYNFDCTNVGANTVSMFVFDSNGNSDTCQATVNVIDTVSPALSVQNLTLYLDSSGQATVTAADVDNGTADACGIDTLILDRYQFSCSDSGMQNVTFTAVDVNSNQSSVSVDITVVDNIAPQAVARNLNVYLDASGQASITAADIDSGSTDICGIDTLVLDTYNFTCADVGAQSVNLSATDFSGNVSTTTSQVTILDTVPPALATKNISIYLNTSGIASITAADVVKSVNDACGVDTVVLNTYNFTCTELGFNTVQVSATDNNGNTTTTNATVLVLDNVKPKVWAKNIDVYLDSAGQASITTTDVEDSLYSACGISNTYLDRYNFTCADTGVNKVVLTAMTVNGMIGTDTAEVRVWDTISPVVVPKNINVYLNASGQASVAAADIDSATSDACGIDTLVLDRYLFTCADVGANPVQITATDIHGNIGSATATVSVWDTVKPSFVANNITVHLDSSGQAAIVASDVSSSVADACRIGTVLLDQYSFDCSEVGVNAVSVTATDTYGNSHSQQVNVTVEDSIGPELTTMAADLYLNSSGQAVANAAALVQSVNDPCGIDTLVLDQYNFNCSHIGANTITVTAYDSFGNSTSVSAVLSVHDTVSPVLIVSSVPLYLDANGLASLNSLDASAFLHESCGLDTFYFSQDTLSCAALGENRLGITAFDESGNRLDDSLGIWVYDTIPPTVTGQGLSVYLDSSGNASITAAAVDLSSSDVCGIDSLFLDRYTFSCADLGANQVVLTGLDVNGLPASDTVVVTVMDSIQPYVSANDITLYLNAQGTATISVADVDNGSFDPNCSYSLSLSDSVFNCSHLGTNTVSLSIIDADGNLSSTNFVVTVLDSIGPEVLLKNNVSLALGSDGKTTLTAGIVDSATTDNCSNNLSFSFSKTEFTCSDLGSDSAVVSVIDTNGNITSVVVGLSIEDLLAPVILTRNHTVYLDASGTVTVPAQDVDDGTSDNCTLDSIWLGKSVFTGADLGPNTVLFYAIDLEGNVSTGNTIITVLDTMSPVFSGQAINLYLDSSGQAGLTTADMATVVTDNHGIDTLKTNRTSFDCSDRGGKVINITATDSSANTTTAAVLVNVIDTLAPDIEVTDVNLYLDASGTASLTVADVDTGTVDNCQLQSMGLDQTTFSCADLGANSVSFRAMDADSNAATQNLVVTVFDTIAPSVAQVQGPLQVESDSGSCGAMVSFSLPAASDNCGNVSVTSSHQSGDFFPVGATKVLFTARDTSGNTDTTSLQVVVIDNEAPVITSLPADDSVGTCQSYYHFAMPVATDNCGVTVTQIGGIPSGGYYPVGKTTNTFLISDAHGNDTVVSFSVVINQGSQPSLPNALKLCVNDAAVDVAQGQNIHWSGKGMLNDSIFDPEVAGPGTHEVDYLYVDEYGCPFSGNIKITVAPQPIKPVLTRAASTTLSTGAYHTYQWYRNGIAIPGATSRSYSYTIGGNYQVLVTNSSGCESYSDGHVVGTNGGGIGIDENPLASLSVYPNPSSGAITVDLNNLMSEELEVSLYSITGKEVFRQRDITDGDGTLRLNLENLPKAAYVLRVQSESEVVVRQIVFY